MFSSCALKGLDKVSWLILWYYCNNKTCIGLQSHFKFCKAFLYLNIQEGFCRVSQEILKAFNLFHVLRIWNRCLIGFASSIWRTTSSSHNFCRWLSLCLDFIVGTTSAKLLFIKGSILNIVSLQKNCRLLQEVTNCFFLHLSLHDITILITQGPIREVEILPLCEIEESWGENWYTFTASKLFSQSSEGIVWEKLEGPSMYSCLGWVIDTAHGYCYTLDCLFLTFFLNLNIIDRDFIYSKAVDSLASPFNQRSFLHEEFIRLVPEFSGMDLDIHSNILFLEPQDILTLRKASDLHIVHSMLISFIYYELRLRNLIAYVGTTALANLEKLEVSWLNRRMLEGKSHLLLR